MMLLFQIPNIAALRTIFSAMQGSQKIQELRFIDLLLKGGWLMLPIFLLAFGSLVVFLERYISIHKASGGEFKLIKQVKQQISLGDLNGALRICSNHKKPGGRMLQKGIFCIGKPTREIQISMENMGRLELSKLDKNIQFLSIAASIAPMLGFVGTIIGVIMVFHDVSITGTIEIGTVSGGLYTKMITSAAGLTVGIAAYIFYHILNSMIDKVALRLETMALEFIDLLEGPGYEVEEKETL